MKNNLILLHGALGSKVQFSKLAPKLEKKFKVYAFDFEGHGNSVSQNNFSMDLFSENVLAFMEENNIEVADFFGYSMGGYVALTFAKKNPEKVGKIMTLGTKFNWTPEVAAKETKMLDPERVEEKVPKFAAFLKPRHPAQDWKEVMRKTAQMMLDIGGGKGLQMTDLERIKTNILVTIGSLDNMVSVEESQRAASALPNGNLKILDGVEHVFEKIDLNKILEEINDFF